jgi:thiamine-monophosphate kinase
MELDFVRWLQTNLDGGHNREQLQNDAASVEWEPGKSCVVTTDMIADGSHFVLDQVDPRRVGHKALGVNLSDLAAMGARPVGAFVSLLLPPANPEKLAREIMLGMLPLSQRCRCPILGGDTNCWDGKLVINVTAIGDAPKENPWKRSGLIAGDLLFVTGDLGGSICGHHLDFEPRIEEAQFLRDNFQVHAAMDISDGLALDASRMATASQCGIEFDEHTIPVSAAARSQARNASGNPLKAALEDGEDFELLFAIPPDQVDELVRCWPFETRLTKIGRWTAAQGIWLKQLDGRSVPLEARGYEHKRTL